MLVVLNSTRGAFACSHAHVGMGRTINGRLSVAPSQESKSFYSQERESKFFGSKNAKHHHVTIVGPSWGRVAIYHECIIEFDSYKGVEHDPLDEKQSLFLT